MISYLGPKGTFSEIAAKRFGNELKEKIQPEKSISDVITEVSDGTIKWGVVPYFNRLAGVVQESLDGIYRNNLIISDLELVPVSFGIGGYSNDIVMSHPKGLAQCSSYLKREFPKIKQENSLSTAKAAEIVAKTKKGMAISLVETLKNLGIPVIDEKIGNQKENHTKFFLIGKKKIPQETGEYQTMIALTPPNDRKGLLKTIFEIVENNDINCSNIISMPTTLPVDVTGITPQMFYLELMCGDTLNLTNCLEDLVKELTPKKKQIETVKVLGTYRSAKI